MNNSNGLLGYRECGDVLTNGGTVNFSGFCSIQYGWLVSRSACQLCTVVTRLLGSCQYRGEIAYQ